MTWLALALLGFLAIGVGVGLTRSEPRGALTGGWQQVLRQWLPTLAGRRLAGALLVAGGALVILLVLVLRP
jgi:hypothetical protein